GERENRRSVFFAGSRAGFAKRHLKSSAGCESLFPLPGGEGQGEGERRVRTSISVQIVSRVVWVVLLLCSSLICSAAAKQKPAVTKVASLEIAAGALKAGELLHLRG